MNESGSFSLMLPARLGSSTWLLHLRTFAVVGQLATVVSAAVFTGLQISYTTILALIGLTALSNLAYAWWLHRETSERETRGLAWRGSEQTSRVGEQISRGEESDTHQSVALLLMIADLVTLTGMLTQSGGVSNPFSFFYFVNLAVGGVMIRRRATWILAAVAILGYCVLVLFSPAIDGLAWPTATRTGLQTFGLVFAFSACSLVVTYFVTRTAGDLRRSQQQLLAAQAARDASHRLEGLTTLAAGAAHELATPLSTINVIVKELSRHLEECEKPDSVNEDLTLIDQELEHCRQVLQRMRTAAGDSMAPRWSQTTVGELIDAVLEGVRDPHRVDVPDDLESLESTPLWVPQEALAQAVRNLVHNALDASTPPAHVRLFPALVDGQLQLTVSDDGTGMNTEVMQRALDPFFTTKEPGRGIGLGLFLTRNVISELGGQLTFQTVIDAGTDAIVTLPPRRPGSTASSRLAMVGQHDKMP